MYRYSTKPIELSLPFNLNETQNFWLVFKQEESGTEHVFKKADLAEQLAAIRKTEDGEYVMEISLTQKQCGDFSAVYPVSVQIRYLDTNGISDATTTETFELSEVLKEGVLNETET